MTTQDRHIFKTQFILNYLNQTPQKKLQFVLDKFLRVGNYQEYIEKGMLPLLKSRTHDNKPHQTQFLIRAREDLEKLLRGEFETSASQVAQP